MPDHPSRTTAAINHRTRTAQVLLLLILLLALALRLWLWSRPDHPLANDETEYLPVARDLAHGHGFVFYDSYRWLRAPLYPLFLALFLRLGGDNLRVVTLAQVLLSTATVYGFYLLARRLFPGERSERAGLLSALLAALLLPFATFPALFMAETLFTFLLVAFFLALLQVPAALPGQQVRWALAAGVLLGLCALTRAVALAFLPLAALWLYFSLRRKPPPGVENQRGLEGENGQHPNVQRRPRMGWLRLGSPIGLPLLLALAGLATIAPWTVRNAIAYGRFIPLDTGSSYSLWAFYEPHEELDEINHQLEAIPNPADRQALAIGKWLGRLREDPAVLLRHVASTFPYLLRIKPIEDRFLKLPYREPSLPYFILALLLDDGLYVLITIAALVALLFLPTDRGKALALLWLVYNVAVMIALHAEARYRLLLFPALIPYAALALAEGRHLFASARKGLVWKAATLALLLAGWGYCFVVYSPWEWVRVNVQRGSYQMAGQLNWALGRPEAARQAYIQATAVDERNPEPYYDLAWTLEHLGRLEEAAQVYRQCWNVRITYLPCSTALGNILRQQGQARPARTAFRGRYVDEADVVAWAWDHLDVSPLARLEVGDGLDYGYLSGVYATEAAGGVNYRWTTARALFRLSAAEGGEARLRLRLAGPRLGGAPAAVVEVWVAGRQVARWEVSPTWTTYETAPFPLGEGQRLEVILQSSTFVPQEVDPSSLDSRALGVQVDWVEIVTGITGNATRFGYNGCTPFP